MSDKNQKIYDKFNHDVSWMIIHAKAASINAEADCLYPESFVVGVLSTGENSVTSLLIQNNIDLEKCLKIFKGKLAEKKGKKSSEETTNYENLKKAKIIDEIIIAANKVSIDWGQDFISLQHIFLAVLQLCPDVRTVFESQGLNFSDFIDKIKKHKQKKSQKAPKPSNSGSTPSKGNALDNFCVNMTEQAALNKYDPIIARETEIEEAITILCRRNKSNPILIGEAGVGKAQLLSSLVLTINGWKTMGEITTKDVVITPCGKTSEVVGVYPQGKKDVVKFTFDDGRTTRCCKDHLWKVYGIQKENETRISKWSIENSQTLLEKHNYATNKGRIKIPLVGENVCDLISSRNDLFIHPYILGVVLGDGNICNGSVRISSNDNEIIAKISRCLDKNYKIKKITNSKFDYRITSIHKEQKRFNKGEFGNKYVEELNKLNMWGKHSFDKYIPDQYKKLNISDKYDLLNGLFDADGTVAKNVSISYSTASIKLAKDIQELIWSIGGICRISEKHPQYTYKSVKKQGRINYTLNIRLKYPNKIFSLARKKSKLKIANQYSNNLGLGIKNIMKDGIEATQCIKIADPEGLYITDNYIVTHNTAIVEGICQRIVSNTVPKKLRGSRIYAVDIAGMVAGTKYRGEFEKRLQELLKELKDDEGAIIFIDEIHNIVGAGSASGSVDAANMMKPALARYLKCIGATTNAEYKKYFAGDGALERRFEKLEIDEPSKESVHKILVGIKTRLEEYHKCIITDNAIDMAIRLTDRYTPEKHFPDKAISCIDTACAKYAWEENEMPTISPNDIAMVISKQTKIPMEVMLWDNFERIKNTEKTLLTRVIGQDHAVQTICRTLKNAYSGVRNPDKPIGIFIFGGPTGTGKTYLAKEVAKVLFSSDSSFIKLDMSEFSEPHSVSKITGSPPGYVGFNEVNVIADKIRRKPYCVLLLDEMEKAHPDVMKLFLQVMSDGAFTDSIGNKVNCKNLILIMTGNFGMNSKTSISIGFGDGESKTEVQKEQERLIQYCKERFGAEFVNRADDFVPFVDLSEEDLVRIAILRLQDFVGRISNKNCKFVIASNVAESIVAMSKQEHGTNANVINRIIEKNLEAALADTLLSIEEDIAYIINVDVKDGVFVVESSKVKKSRRKQLNEQTV